MIRLSPRSTRIPYTTLFRSLVTVVGLAVAVGRQKPRHGVVLPFRSDRRADVTAPPDETVISRSCCGTCGQAITDEPKAVVDKGAVFHATCWLQRGVKGRQ